MFKNPWLRLGLSLVVGVTAVCVLLAWGQSAAASDAPDRAVPLAVPTAEPPSPPPAIVQADVPWALLAPGQVSTLTLNLGLHDALVSGGAPRPDPVELELLRGGEIIATATADPFPDASGGYLYAATLYRYYGRTLAGGGGRGYYDCLVEAGDELRATQAGTVISLTVPLLTALADASSATVFGQAPPSATLEVYLYPYADPSVDYQGIVTAGPTGTYALDFSPQMTMTARDYGFVFYADATGGQVYRRYNAPYLQFGLGDDFVDGVVAPCTFITLSLSNDTGPLGIWSGYYSYSDGEFHLYLDSTIVEAGQQAVITAAGQVVSLTIPTLTASADPTADQVTGTAAPGVRVRVDLFRGPQTGYHEGPPDGEPAASETVTAATPSGIYTITFSDISAGDYGAAYVSHLQGHRIYRRFLVPFLRARLGEYLLDGQVNEGGPITVTIIGRSGLVRDVRSTYADPTGHFYDEADWSWPYDVMRLLIGDRVSTTTGSGAVMALSMPTLTAHASLAQNAVFGQAPPLSPLRVGLSPDNYYLPLGGGWEYPEYDYPYTLTLTSTAGGVYTADLSSLVTMTIGDRGAVFYISPEGYEVVLEFAVPYIWAQVGGDQVRGVIDGAGMVWVTLRDPVGTVKASAADYRDPWEAGSFQVFFAAAIEGGDTIEVVANEKVVLVQVPPLSLVADHQTDTLSGVAPPHASLDLTCSGSGCGRQTWVVTATDTGAYNLDLAGQVDISRGDRLSITYADPEGNQFYAEQRIAWLRAKLYSPIVFVTGPTDVAVALTLLAADDTLLTTITTTLYAGEGSIYLTDPVSWTYVLLEPGQTIRADVAGERMELVLPLLTAQADVEEDTVTGLAPPGAVLDVQFDWQTSHVTATTAGTYSIDLSGVVDIAPGSTGHVAYSDEERNQVLVEFGGPFVSVTLGDSWVNGMAPSSGPITVTLYDATGQFKGSGAQDWADWSYGPSFYLWLYDSVGNPAPVVAGDRLVVQSPGAASSFVVPELSAAFDLKRNVLSGVAPAGAWLEVELVGDYRHIRAATDGTYAMDWADLAPGAGTWGVVSYVDDEHNTTIVQFQVPYYRAYLPAVAKGGP